MWKKFITGWLIAMIVTAGGAAFAAPIWLSDDRGSVAVDNVLNDDSYIVGGTVTVSQDVRGDLFVFGGTVTIEGDVQDDLFVLGGDVVMNGTVGDDVRILAGNTRLTSTVRDDVLMAGGALELADSARVGGDMRFGGGELDLDGQIAGNLQAGFGAGRFNAVVGGDAKLEYADELRIGDAARIAGGLTYSAPQPNPTLEGVAGSSEFLKISTREWSAGGLLAFLTVAGLLALLWKWLLLLFVGAIIIWVLPKYFPRLVDTMRARKSMWSSVWAGLVILVGVPLLNFILTLTIIGIPLAIVLTLAYVILIMFGAVVGAYGVGSVIRRHQHKNEWEQLGNLALGGLIVLVLAVVPIIGWLLSLGVVLFGIGAIWFEKLRLVQEYRK